MTVASAAAPVAAQAPLLDSFDPTYGYGPRGNCLYPNDDGSSRTAIPITAAFGSSGLNFFGRRYTSMWVNTNGNITFNAALSTFTPRAFPIASQPMIAPYWSDVDIRGETCGSGTPGDCQNPTQNGVWWVVVPRSPASDGGAATPGRAVITWDEVGYFSCRDDRKMSFQLILSEATQNFCAGRGDFDVEFRYAQCEWTTGSASSGAFGYGGTPGQAGFDAGNQRDFIEIMGSRTSCDVRCGDGVTNGFTKCDTAPGGTPCMAGDLCPMANQACVQTNTGTCNATACDANMRTCPAGSACNVDMGRCCTVPRVCTSLRPATGAAACTVDQSIDTILCTGTNVPADQASTCPPSTARPGGDCRGIWRFQIRSGSVQCPGAGEDCVATTNGMPGGPPRLGVCAKGIKRCQGTGTQCVQEVMASAERCDALDNDCNGMTDEGDLCPGQQTCQAGRCVDRCFEGGCGVGETCTAEGLCVADQCVGVTCMTGQRCVAGQCVDACVGVICPTGQSCRAGGCVDLCAGTTCDEFTTCREGRCVAACPRCVTCATGEVCLGDGVCGDPACAGVTCAMGTRCVAGQCVDNCQGAVCPTGQMCTMGQCVAIPMTTPDAGPRPGDAGASGGDGSVPPGQDGGVAAGGDGSIAEMDSGCPNGVCGPVKTGRGCSCVAVGSASSSDAPLAALLGFAMGVPLLVRRRRK